MHKRNFRYFSGGVLIALLAGCSSMPATQPELAQARGAYAAAKAKAWVNEYAQVEMYEADLALQRAEQAKTADEQKQFAYIAERKIQIAEAVANRKISSTTISELGKEKDQMLLEARDAEIELERKRADRLAAQLAELKAKNEARDADAELAGPGAAKTDRGMLLTLGDAQFENEQAQLLPDAYGTIDKIAAFLAAHPDRSVLVEGHGFQDNATDLAQGRADAVRDALVSRQVPSSRIASKGSGAGAPPAGTGNDGQQSRRVDIIILDPGATPEALAR